MQVRATPSACRSGLIGAGISTSLSPALHEAEGAHHDLDLSYSLLDVGASSRSLRDLIRWARDEGFAGLNITHPFKQQVIRELDAISPEAEAIGAVNTVVFTDGHSTGHNTDGPGYAQAFAQGLPQVRRNLVLQCGAGGAGAAVAHAQLAAGMGHLVVADPDQGKRKVLVEALTSRFGAARVSEGVDDPYTLLADADGLVNASPIGMADHPGTPVPRDALHPGLWVSDVVYMPVQTELLRHARDLGLPTLSGVQMCVFQAAGAFRLITGLGPDVDRMVQHLGELLTARGEDR